jgi:hypothetical protein
MVMLKLTDDQEEALANTLDAGVAYARNAELHARGLAGAPLHALLMGALDQLYQADRTFWQIVAEAEGGDAGQDQDHLAR